MSGSRLGQPPGASCARRWSRSPSARVPSARSMSARRGRQRCGKLSSSNAYDCLRLIRASQRSQRRWRPHVHAQDYSWNSFRLTAGPPDETLPLLDQLATHMSYGTTLSELHADDAGVLRTNLSSLPVASPSARLNVRLRSRSSTFCQVRSRLAIACTAGPAPRAVPISWCCRYYCRGV